MRTIVTYWRGHEDHLDAPRHIFFSIYIVHFQTLERSTVATIKQCLGGADRHAFIFGTHERDQSLDRLVAMLTG